MKKFALLLVLNFIVSPVLAANIYYSGFGPQKIVTTSTLKYSPSYRVIRNSSDTQALQALFAGSSIAAGRLYLTNTPSLRAVNSRLSYLDPYVINIDGKDYILIKDNPNNEWSVQNILGCDDTKDDLFASLKKLESDGDTAKITSKELKKAGVRFALLNSDGSVALNERNLDYDLNNVQYIDMKNLRTALGNKNQDGTFGYFYVIIKEGSKKRAVAGRVTFEEKSELNKYIN